MAGAPPPEAAAMFVVTFNGPVARAEVAIGLEGVRDAFLHAVWGGGAGESVLPAELAALLEDLEAPDRWAPHGAGDGQPYWHLWAPLGEGSVSIQRLTVPLPEQVRLTARLREVASALAGSAAELRALAQAAPRDGLSEG